MVLAQKLRDSLIKLKKPTLIIYPLIIIIGIPVLLIINTVWNLKSFNRDVNFVIRHQAVSITDTLKPFIEQDISDSEKISSILADSVQSNSDIVSATLLKSEDGKFVLVNTTSPIYEISELTGLNQLALGFNQPFAGLTYDPNLKKNVWNVVTPLEIQTENPYFINLKLKTDTVDEVLSRTSRDSLIIMAILVAVSLALLANHFLFYRKSLKAQQLEELGKLKDEFISMAAHELKAPLTGLIGYLQLLRDKITPAQLPAIQNDLSTLDMLTIDLRNLINDLLDVSRIEQGRIKISTSEMQINDIIAKVINTLSPQAQQKTLAINFSPKEIPVIKTDPDRVRQVITNLVSNALKYTLKGSVTITADVEDKFIKVKVVDTGIGIPAEEFTKLFSKFHRIKDQKTIEVRGTGLGLWITKQIVELLGGKIHAESIYGTGTSITFTLPLTTS